MNNYVGNSLQIRGAERYILQDGKGDGMHFIYVRNGKGLEAWISVDRAGDISRIAVDGKNMGFFSPCGYVAPNYYDKEGLGFLKSFTAGFITTCGLTQVGSPCEDDGEILPLHGTVSHIPATVCVMDEDKDGVTIKLKLIDSVIFGKKLELCRVYRFSYNENSFEMTDTVNNIGDSKSPYMVLYHCNMGYPLLTENSVIKIPFNSQSARDDHAEKYMDTALLSEKPQVEYQERCYYYDVKEQGGTAKVGIYNPDFNVGMVMAYDKKGLDCFTQWKMMGVNDYVMGLEAGNCNADGRSVTREKGLLKFLEPGESGTTNIKFSFVSDKAEFDGNF
jgi:hypothetical protein